jgi:site-specific DNA recombinase
MSTKSTDTPSATAWIYLRVSTKRQAYKGGLPEGFSLPAQRDACTDLAQAKVAVVTREYNEKGESAKTTQRPELQRLLRDLAQFPPPTYVIVYAVDRWARDTIDFFALKATLRSFGVKLINARTPLGDTIEGEFMETVEAGLAQMENRRHGQRVAGGLRKAAENGGTNGKAPVGYLNKRDYDEGRERKWVEVDPERAPHVVWAYERYATGEWTTRQLERALEQRGLTTAPSAQRLSRSLSHSMVARMLQDRYYLGEVKHKGVWYPGRHEQLIPTELFERVGQVLRTKSEAREKHRKHPNYLKGTIFCLRCGSRYCVQIARGRGGTYEYFFCLGRNKYRNNCTQGHLHIEAVEEAIERFYDTVSLHAHEISKLRELVEQALTESQAGIQADHTRLDKQRDKLLTERTKLLQLHYDDRLPADLFGTEIERIEQALKAVEHQARHLDQPFEGAVQDLIDLEALLHDLGQLYRHCDAIARRQINQSLFRKLLVGNDGVEGAEPAALIEGIVGLSSSAAPEGAPTFVGRIRVAEAKRAHQGRKNKNPDHSRGQGSNYADLVELMGLEPTTPCLQSTIGRFRDHGRYRVSPGQAPDPLTATTAQWPRFPIEKGTWWARRRTVTREASPGAVRVEMSIDPVPATSSEHLELPVEELLRRVRPLPSPEEMVIDDLTPEEGEAFLDAVRS